MQHVKVPISAIRRDGGTQARMTMDRSAIQEYAEKMKSGSEFPPVRLFIEGDDYWLGDGFHRVEAAILAGLKEIEADAELGGLRAARFYATGANGNHGVRRTQEDKRMAVNMLLQDSEWSAMSDRQIASHCDVSQPFVSALRSKLATPEITPKSDNVITEQTSKKTVKQPVEHVVDAVEETADPTPETIPVVESPKPKPEPKAQPSGDPREVERLKAENEELKERLEETASILSETKEELDAARRALDAEDLLAQFDKEIKRAQAQAHVVQTRNNGLMNENADLKCRLRSALKKIERLEKMQVAA